MQLFLEQKNNEGAELLMERSRKLKIGFDGAILLSGVCISFILLFLDTQIIWIQVLIYLCGFLAAVDLLFQLGTKDHKKYKTSGSYSEAKAGQLVLLDEHDKPLKSWDLAGKTALILGKKNDEEEVDVDLTECEYSTFINDQHAVLNFCLDSWYLEDLGSQNGVKIKKVEDGGCYQVTNRPCRVSAGDVIYLASTRLLLT